MYIKGMQRNVAAMGTRSRQHDNHSDCVGETVIGIVGNNFPVSRWTVSIADLPDLMYITCITFLVKIISNKYWI